jgi:hypothetical protein
MAIDEFTKEVVTRKLDNFIDEKIPPHAREQVNLTYSFWKDSVILYELRKVPFPRGSESIVKHKVARMDFNKNTKGWTLFAYDRNEKSLWYPDLDNDVSFEAVLEEIDEDPTCIFWG